jgi:CRISPR/Cas system CSM-associated protein Csm3 (group 7 of RAMP superfamily)
MNVSYRPYRLEIRGKLKAQAAFHIGSGQNFHTASDSPLLRGPDGATYIPGSSLRGLLRAHLEREAPLLGCGQAEIDTLFGSTSDTLTQTGRFQLLDAHTATGQEPDAEIRDHVRIDDRTGAAGFGAKFDLETAAAVSTFDFEAIYEGDGKDDPEMILVAEALRFLASEAFYAGAKQAWGLGRMQLDGDLEVLEFDRGTPDGLQSYLKWRLNGTKPASAPLPAPGARAIPGAAGKAWNTLRLDLELQFEGPLLVKSAIPATGDDSKADMHNPFTYWAKAIANADGTPVTSITNPGAYYLPGSSLRGVLRHEALWIAGKDTARLNQVDKLFGFAKGAKAGEAGRIKIEDGVLCGKLNIIALDHVAIDRIVAGAADGKKFDSAALDSPRFKTRIVVQFEQDQAGLLKWLRALVRQMENGRLWAGSGSSRGYGLLKSIKVVSASADLVDSLGWKLTGTQTEVRPGRTLHNMQNQAQLQALWSVL